MKWKWWRRVKFLSRMAKYRKLVLWNNGFFGFCARRRIHGIDFFDGFWSFLNCDDIIQVDRFVMSRYQPNQTTHGLLSYFFVVWIKMSLKGQVTWQVRDEGKFRFFLFYICLRWQFLRLGRRNQSHFIWGVMVSHYCCLHSFQQWRNLEMETEVVKYSKFSRNYDIFLVWNLVPGMKKIVKIKESEAVILAKLQIFVGGR